MDIEQEDMQFLGLVGIYKEAYKVILSYRRIFSQITLALILPLSFILLAHIEVTDVLFEKIIHNEHDLDRYPDGTPSYDKISDVLYKEWTMFFLFKAIYLTFLLIFSLLSTSAVVYTIACVYTSREITFKKVMSVVPKVWKRLMVTFLCMFFVTFLYNTMCILVMLICVFSIGNTNLGFPVLIVLLIVYLTGLVYISIIWHLASVVSVLEDEYGFKAMIKSRSLIKGNMVVALIVFFQMNLSFGLIQFVFENHVVHGEFFGMVSRLGFGILSLLLLLALMLFALVMQTVIYFVCKSYHHENIDKSSLSDHLEVYLGDYVPLKNKDVQLEHYYV